MSDSIFEAGKCLRKESLKTFHTDRANASVGNTKRCLQEAEAGDYINANLLPSFAISRLKQSGEMDDSVPMGEKRNWKFLKSIITLIISAF